MNRNAFAPLLVLCLMNALHAESAAWAKPPSPPAAAAGPAPTAKQREEAERHFKRGLELFDETDYQAALIEFQRAYQISPAYQVLYNVGQVHYQLQNYAGALRSFEKFLSDGGNRISAERRAEVEREIGKLRARIATVDITTAPGAAIYVDEVAMGTTPLSSPIQVSAGRRRIRAVLPSHETVEKTLDLAGGDTVKLELVGDASGNTPQAPAPEGSSNTAMWVCWGLTGAFGIGWGVTGALATDASGTANNIAKHGGQLSDYQTADNHMHTYGYIADGLGIATIISAGLATYFTLTRSKKASHVVGAQSPSVHAQPSLGGLTLTF